MKATLLLLVGGLLSLASAQLGSVHCKVGCACSEEYHPVCGSDRRTYANECKLRCTQCSIPGLESVFTGRCEDAVLLAPVAGYTTSSVIGGQVVLAQPAPPPPAQVYATPAQPAPPPPAQPAPPPPAQVYATPAHPAPPTYISYVAYVPAAGTYITRQ